MKMVTQRALVVVNERIKPFSTRLEPLSMKLADFVRLTVCSIGQAVGIKRLVAWVCGLTIRRGNSLPQDAPSSPLNDSD